MTNRTKIEPLPYKTRQRTFSFLILVFIVAIPFLYLYATGYRFDFAKPTNFVSTGGMYVAVDRAGAEIFIDGELVRETRTFRKAFYAQNLDAGTHRVHVQKAGYHTWVKELPVSKRLVTEAEAFNLPLVPQVRVITEWQSATGSMIVRAPVTNASTTNVILATTTTATTTFLVNTEYRTLREHFGTTSTSSVKETTAQQIKDLLRGVATSSTDVIEEATTTVQAGGVKLFESNGDVYASWVGEFEQMPYYYCAPDFPAYSTTTSTTTELTASAIKTLAVQDTVPEEDPELMHPVQTVPKDVICEPTIRIDRKGEEVQHFEFLPGSTDFVILVLIEGIFVVEIDDRGWQNAQPLILGQHLKIYTENGNIFVYDGTLIYQVIITTE